MARNVADLLWEMLANAGVKRCYGIVGDALNPVIDALRRNGKIEFIHVRHEEYGVFAAVAEAYLTGNPVAVCGTAGPGVVHLFNGLMDARKEGAPIIAIAGDVETKLIDTAALEELNPYKFFDAASLYTGRVVNPEQARAIINTAILDRRHGKRAHGNFASGRRRRGRCAGRTHPRDHDSLPRQSFALPTPTSISSRNDRRCEDGSDLRRRWLQGCPRRSAPTGQAS